MELSIPLAVAMKDMLKLASTTKEVKQILHTQEVLIDGARAHNHDQSVGFLGSLTFPALKASYRLTINTKNTLVFIPIQSAEAKARPCRVEGKTILGKDKVQINCSGGCNVIVKKDEYKTANTVLIDVEKNTITNQLPFEKGCLVFLYKGTHVGHLATVEEVKGRTVMLKADDGQVFETARTYCFVVGKGKPAFTIK